MDRETFDLIVRNPEKVMDCPMALQPRNRGPVLASRGIIRVPGGDDLQVDVTYNPETTAVTINVSESGAGAPICRLCVRGRRHGASGRTHKHGLRDPRDQARNLPHAEAKPDLENATFDQVLDWFAGASNLRIVNRPPAPREAS